MARTVALVRWVGVAAAVLVPCVAMGHNQATPIELWGPFEPGTLTCLRMVSRATHACFDTVLSVEQRCQDALLRGESCDRNAVDAAVDAATQEMRATLTTQCALGQLTELGYIGFFDAQTDLEKACVTQAHASISATYAPALGGTPSTMAATCMAASAAYGRKVARFLLERESPVMERIATRLFSGEEKKASILQVERELSETRQHWIAGVLELCPAFEAVYGRSPESFLRTLKQCTDCVLSLTYIHSAVVCPMQVCGNGIPEGTEQCDDGNADDTDICRSDCTLNPARNP